MSANAAVASALKRLSHAGFLAQTETIHLKLTDHVLLRGPVPPPFPSLEVLGEHNNKYRNFYHGALNGDRVMRAHRDGARAESTEDYIKMFNYLHTLVNGDVSQLLDTGYPLAERKPRNGSNAAASTAPTRVTLTHGASGVLMLSCARAGNAALDVWICSSDPTVEANWQHYNSYNRATGMAITGRQPGQKYHVRVRYVTSVGNGPFSEPVSLYSM